MWTDVLGVFDKFIKVTKEMAKLPALLLPQYNSCAKDLYEITQRILKANENLSRWLYSFLYFDFRQTDARSKFLGLVTQYKSMKSGSEFKALKFSCGDINSIYEKNIQSKLGVLLTDQTKRAEAEGMFAELNEVDSNLVAFVYDNVIKILDTVVDTMEKNVDQGALDDAEASRLRAKADLKQITERLETFAGALSELTLSFAKIAKVPVTLNTVR